MTGMSDAIKALKLFDPELERAAKNNLKQIAEIIARAAARRLPKDGGAGVRFVTDTNGKVRRRKKEYTGAARDSIVVRETTSAKGRNAIFIQGGNSKAPYFGWLDFGGTLKPEGERKATIVRPFIKTGRFIYPAAAANAEKVNAALDSAVDSVTRKLDLS